MHAINRFNLAVCAMERAKLAVREDNWKRCDHEMRTWSTWAEYGTVSVSNAIDKARSARHDGWMEGFSKAESILRQQSYL